jgi:hypothetical protein
MDSPHPQEGSTDVFSLSDQGTLLSRIPGHRLTVFVPCISLVGQVAVRRGDWLRELG